MTSRVELEINAGTTQAAELFADPRNNTEWMDDIDRVEPISGDLGAAGSVYRLVPKRGGMVFLVTVVARALPTTLTLALNSDRVSLVATDTFVAISDRTTKLVSEEVFVFKGLIGKISGAFGRGAIRAAHRRHMEGFRRFAERRASQPVVP